MAIGAMQALLAWLAHAAAAGPAPPDAAFSRSPEGPRVAVPALAPPPAGAVALPPAAGPAPAPEAEPSPVPGARAVDSVPAALAEILARAPRVVAFGEIHQTTATLGVPSAIKRFTDELLAVAAPGAGDLVVETWISEGHCGEAEKAVVADVGKTTERPAATEDEVVTLIRKAKDAGVTPHILSLSCRDYEAVHPKGGGVDYEAMLKLTSDKLESGIAEVLARRKPDDARAVLVYGGALHNDLYPVPELAPFTFGRHVRDRVGGRYVEVDLYVPEYLDGNRALRAERWYGVYKKVARGGKAVLITRAPDSYVIVFARTRKPAATKKGRPP